MSGKGVLTFDGAQFCVVKLQDEIGFDWYYVISKPNDMIVMKVKAQYVANMYAKDLDKGAIPLDSFELYDGFGDPADKILGSVGKGAGGKNGGGGQQAGAKQGSTGKPSAKPKSAKATVEYDGGAYIVVKQKESGGYTSYVVSKADSTVIEATTNHDLAVVDAHLLDAGAFKTDKFGDSDGYGMSAEKAFGKKGAAELGLAGAKQDPKKPIGSTAPSIVSVADKGAYKVVALDDGTFGAFVPLSGEYELGLKSASGASKSGKTMASHSASAVLKAEGIDPGDDAVETLQALYEQRVREAYQKAYDEMAAKLAKEYGKYDSAMASMQARLGNGEITQDQYDAWASMQAAVINGQEGLAADLANTLADADKTAMSMLNGYVIPAYEENLAYGTFQIEQAAHIDTSFSLYNRHAVTELLRDPDQKLLPSAADVEADKKWCTQKITSCITQSVLQGESVPHAAKRLETVVGMSANSAKRAAQTALHSAANMGKMDAGKRAAAMGIKLKKQWVSTADARTRPSHVIIDRETVEIDEKFSNGLMYPCDKNGPGHEVWNCRCAMRYVLPGHEYDDLPSTTKEGKDYAEWKAEHAAAQKTEEESLQDEIDKLQASKDALVSALPQDGQYAYGELFSHSTSLSKWQDEQQSIKDGLEYCQKKEQGIKDAHYDQSTGSWDSTDWEAKAKHYSDKYQAILAYDHDGAAYHDAHEAVKAQLDGIDSELKDKRRKLTEASAGEMRQYDQGRLDSTEWFHSSKEADDRLRSLSGDAWRAASREEREAINTYTGGSYSEYNMPLSGCQGSYKNFVGFDAVDIDADGYGSEIRAMTRIIERSVTEDDMWLRRGVGKHALSSFFGYDTAFDMTSLKDSDIDALAGTVGRIGAFQSCGTTETTGFNSFVNMRIFVPAGTEAMYVEPISRCGRGAGLSWDGKSKQDYLGGELETILQRGAFMECRRASRKNGKIEVIMVVHPEMGYDKFQQ